jgi:HSP20 family protein
MEEIEEMLPTKNLLDGLSMYEDEKNIYVEAAVPGVDPKEVEVTYANGLLTIRAEKKEEKKDKKYIHRATSSFLYRVDPGDVDPNKEPEAVCKDGVMRVTFAKSPKITPKKIAVKVAK